MKKLNQLRQELSALNEDRNYFKETYRDTIHIVYPKELKENDILIHKKESEIANKEKELYISGLLN